ncbi:Oidioi.mRNA.OKI2018_I69.PAR.g9533.t1.cds [Oikopleura dioica]|uniref:Oidioi.mRNA.OKI2018_I69.PAR.g9533.t1.cds n=1 Tax=Oikopleura dioica TaxID=34765 RepID=A0ABN7RL37_OIKDI|nr:Oidioi.mRNA.OKI2018_I69.PAR.g9533.t1.cds [Oikopleura dioica]
MQAIKICIILVFVNAETDVECGTVYDGRAIQLTGRYLLEMEYDECFSLCTFVHAITYGPSTASGHICNAIYNRGFKRCNLHHTALSKEITETIREFEGTRNTGSVMVRNKKHCSAICDQIPSCFIAVTKSRGRHGHTCSLFSGNFDYTKPGRCNAASCSCKRKPSRSPRTFFA